MKSEYEKIVKFALNKIWHLRFHDFLGPAGRSHFGPENQYFINAKHSKKVYLADKNATKDEASVALKSYGFHFFGFGSE